MLNFRPTDYTQSVLDLKLDSGEISEIIHTFRAHIWRDKEESASSSP